LDVETGALSGAVSTAAGEPVAGVWVLVNAEGDGVQFASQERTDEAGGFRVAALPAGRYRVRLAAGTWAGQPYLREPIEGVIVRAGAETRVPEIVLRLREPDAQSDPR